MTTPINAGLIENIRLRLRKSALSPLSGRTATGQKYPNDKTQRTFVQNPYPSINVTGIGKTGANWKDTDKDFEVPQAAYPELVLDSEAFAAKVKDNLAYKPWADKTTAQRRKEWFDSAKSLAERKVFPGYCNLFSMATVGILTGRNSPLPAGFTVEWMGSGSAATGHMTVVVNRVTTSLLNQPDGWGDNYLIVDSWYALQAGVSPVFWLGEAGELGHYLSFLTEQGKLALYGTFVVGEFTAPVAERTAGTV